MTFEGPRDANPSSDTAIDDHDLTSGIGATRDSLTIGKWTVVSRATGVIRVVMIGATLGPTALGDTYQLTNTLPNLIYYGFLAGSLFSSVLVPSLVVHIDRGDRHATARLAGGFLGVAMLGLALVAPLAVVLLPQALRIAGFGAGGNGLAEQVSVARWLAIMVMPQVLGYAVIGSSVAAMNARRRFALASAAPALENVAIIGILLLVGRLYSTRNVDGTVPTGQLLLLGVGSTLAVGLHAAVQWWGAHRCGVTLRPRAGWHDPEVLGLVKRAVPSLAQSGLVALQMLILLLVASRVPGGTVAMQIAINFYALPIALAATPVALALLPRLARLHHSRREVEFSDTYVRGLGLVLFMTMPAVCGYLVLAGPISHVVTVGQMDTAGATGMVAWALAAVAVGIIGQSVFFVATQAAYAMGNTRTSLIAMVVQTVVCVALCSVALSLNDVAVLAVAGGASSVANLVGGWMLLAQLRRRLPRGSERLRPSLLRAAAGCAAMSVPAAGASYFVTDHVSGRLGSILAVGVAGAVGSGIFAGVLAWLRAPELSWVLRSVSGRPHDLARLTGETL